MFLFVCLSVFVCCCFDWFVFVLCLVCLFLFVFVAFCMCLFVVVRVLPWLSCHWSTLHPRWVSVDLSTQSSWDAALCRAGCLSYSLVRGAPLHAVFSNTLVALYRSEDRPPCRRSTILWPTDRQAGFVALRRALWRLKRLGTNRVSCALGAGRASKRALRRYHKRVPSSLDGRERWQRQGPSSCELASSRSRSPTPRDPSHVNVQTLSRRATARNPVSHACDGQVGRKPRRPDARRCTVFKNHQPASRTSQVIPKPVVGSGHTSQHLGTERVSAQTDVLASLAFRPRWFTPCSTKLLSVTYCAGACAIRRRNMKRPKSSEERQRSRDRNGLPRARVRHQTPACHAQVCVLSFTSRAIAVDDSCEQSAVFRRSRCTLAVAL